MHPPLFLTPLRLICYALPALPLAMLTLPLAVLLPTAYARELGLGLSIVGSILLFTRLWDTISDPLIGIVSDRLGLKALRRKPYILLGLPILILGSFGLFSPTLTEQMTGGYLLLWSLIFYTGYTLMAIPLQAWGAELSDDYDLRSRISGFREGAVILGMLASMTIIGLYSDDSLKAMQLIVLIASSFTIIATVLCLFVVPEPQRPAQQPRVPFRKAVSALWQNRPLFRVLSAYFLNGIANGLPATLFVLFAQVVLQEPESYGPLLVIYFLSGFLAIPLWLKISRKTNKHQTWCVSMLWACLAFSSVALISAGDVKVFMVVCALTGAAFGADIIMPYAIQMDVLDLDRRETNRRRGGLFFAIWGMATKLSLALVVGIAFPVLDKLGCTAETCESTLPLVILYAGVPIALKLWACAIMWRFPLGRVEQKRLITS